ncbi:MAG: ABC transporter substrate-binding protein [Eubacteriales bacterium]|nr:ABC transporter substrate-binding protein [Eubacteriales bacterium]
MKKSIKSLISVSVSAIMAISFVGCGKTQPTEQETVDVTIDSIKLGEDYTDITADLKFLTHKTDVVDTKFKGYIEEFNKLYPNISITYEAITDYANGVTTRLSTGDWGNICMLPTTIDKDEYSNYFTPFGDLSTLSNNYDMLNNATYENIVYGIPSMGNAQGIVYNKKVFEEAGITETPKTPDEFLDALQKIKDNTDSIPLYTNFAADWTMNAWDAYISGSATGNPDYMNEGLLKGKDPFSDRGDQTGPYAVYNLLYEAVKRGLTEDDPTTTDWEGSKGMMNNGEIGTMVLGSWAVSQIQGAGENADDIAYMPFPITVDGKQYATAGPDYCYAINVNSSADEKIASMIYIKWLVEKSGFALSEGGISIVEGDAFPEALKDFTDVELVIDNPAPEGEENLFGDVNNESELGINVSGAIPKQVVEEAVSGTKTMEEMADEWNATWSTAQEINGITPQ